MFLSELRHAFCNQNSFPLAKSQVQPYRPRMILGMVRRTPVFAAAPASTVPRERINAVTWDFVVAVWISFEARFYSPGLRRRSVWLPTPGIFGPEGRRRERVKAQRMSPYPNARPSNSDFDESTPEPARGSRTLLHPDKQRETCSCRRTASSPRELYRRNSRYCMAIIRERGQEKKKYDYSKILDSSTNSRPNEVRGDLLQLIGLCNEPTL